MSLPPRRDLQRQFWQLVRAGASRGDAAESIGLYRQTGERWFRQAGGVTPPSLAHVRHTRPRYLTITERELIFAGIVRGDTIRLIARTIDRAPSTVLRELRRNMRHRYRTLLLLDPTRAGLHRILPLDYRPSLAQQRADQAAARPKLAKLATNPRLHDVVQLLLSELLSPEQISIFLRRAFPEDPEMWVSPETIYQSIYVQGRGALRRELAVCLRTGRALRKPRRSSQERRGRIPGMVNISERPAEVEDRAVPGHWEGDLILGKNGKSAIGTLVERSTRYVMLLHLPNGRKAEEVQDAMVEATKHLPQELWKTLTWDQGSEMANHAQISAATGLDIYFCDPAKPWQRGSNENTNGLLRQYFPHGTDLSVHSPEHLALVSTQLNRRPRKTLGWDSPAQALSKLVSMSLAHGVASTD